MARGEDCVCAAMVSGVEWPRAIAVNRLMSRAALRAAAFWYEISVSKMSPGFGALGSMGVPYDTRETGQGADRACSTLADTVGTGAGGACRR